MASINELDIYHVVQGEVSPIVFVRELSATSNVWHAQRMSLSECYRVITYARIQAAAALG